jgi:hypothetical protein
MSAGAWEILALVMAACFIAEALMLNWYQRHWHDR